MGTAWEEGLGAPPGGYPAPPALPSEVEQGLGAPSEGWEPPKPQPPPEKKEAPPPPPPPTKIELKAPPPATGEPPKGQEVAAVPEVIIPKDAKLAETMADGKPSVYEKDGLRYYAPDSTMYKMGWRTSDEYLYAQQYNVGLGPHSGEGLPANSVIVYYKGVPYRVTQQELEKGGTAEHLRAKIAEGEYFVPVGGISEKGEKAEFILSSKVVERIEKLEPEEQFEQYIKLGLIPTGSQFVKGIGEDWGYIPEHEIERAKEEGAGAEFARAMFSGPTTKQQEEYEKALKEYEDYQKALAELEDYKEGDGYKIAQYLKDNPSRQDTLRKAGFDDKDIAEAFATAKASIETKVALAGERTWVDVRNNRTYTDAELKQVIEKNPKIQNYIRLSPESSRRSMVQVATFIVPPAKAALPEYTIKDVTPLEWGMGAANIALFLVPIATPARIAATVGGRALIGGTQLAAGGIYTADTIKNWEEISKSPARMGVSIFFDTLLIGSAATILRLPISKAASGATSKSKEAIANLFPKATPKTPLPSEFALKQLTEGGRIGPYRYYSDSELVKTVASGQKPLAGVYNPEALKLAKQLGLKVRFDAADRIEKGWSFYRDGKIQTAAADTSLKSYYVFKDSPDGLLAYSKAMKAKAIDRTTTEGFIRYHTEMGKAYGYKPQDIRAFLNNWAGNDRAVKEALSSLEWAIRTGDTVTLKQAAVRLELAAGRLPKQLGTPLKQRAQLMQANPDDFINLAKKPPANPEGIGKGLEANKQFIDIAERQLRRVKAPAKRQAIEEAIKQAKKQVAVKTAVQMPLRKVIMPEEAGKYLPAIAKETKLVKIGKRGILVPIREIAITKPHKIASKYGYEGVTERDVLIAVSSMPLTDQLRIAAINPDIARRIFPEPSAKPSPKVAPIPSTRVEPGIAPKEKEEPRAVPVPQPQPEPQPEPTPKPAPKPMPAPAPAPAPAPMPVPKPTLTPKPVSRAKIPPPPIKPLGNNATDTEKREFANSVEGIVAYRRGELHGKSVWHVHYYPYGDRDRLILLGAAPQGAKTFTGKGSARKTAQVIRGIPPAKPILKDTGAVDDTIMPTHRGITLKSVKDKEIYHKGNVRIIEKAPQEVRQRSTRGRTIGIGKLRKPKPIDLGMGIVQEGRRRHIKLT